MRRQVDLRKLDEFAAEGGANEPSAGEPVQAEEAHRSVYPWEDPNVRNDVIKGMGVPLSEPYLLKLRFIAEHTKWSQRKFCQVKLEEAIDQELNTILGNR